MSTFLYENFHVIIITIIVLLLGIAFVLWKKSRKTAKKVLFLGLSDSGKTALFIHLAYGTIGTSFTSVTTNFEPCYKANNKKTVQLVDIPGNERVHRRYFDQHKVDACGIIFLVDSNHIHKQMRDAAEMLYNILTDVAIKANRCRTLILCNKQDNALSKGSSVIQSMLEKELDLLRTTKSKQLETIDDSDVKRSFLGHRKKPFAFSQCKPITIEFAESVAFSKDPSEIKLKSVYQWFEELK